MLLYGNEIVAFRCGSWKFLGLGAALACSTSIAGSRIVVDFIVDINAGSTRNSRGQRNRKQEEK